MDKILIDRSTVELALEVLEDWDSPVALPAIVALHAALAEPTDPVTYDGWVLREVLFDNGEPIGHRAPEQEPVALIDGNGERVHFSDEAMYHYWIGRNCTKLYTFPPQRQPLTHGEIYTAYITATNQTLRAQDERLAFAFARALEAAHGIKEKHE